MKIAIPTFGDRVSPRFDCAQSVLLVTVNDSEETDRVSLIANDWTPQQRVGELLERGVDTVICGGVDRWSAGTLQSAGVTVYGWVAGEVEASLAALLRGDLDAEATTEGRGRCLCRRLSGDRAEDTASPVPGQRNRGRARKRGGGRRANPGDV